MAEGPRQLRAKSRIGKYRILGLICEGGFAKVYRALDTIEGVELALRIPVEYPLSPATRTALRREIQLTHKLEHPNILPLKNADLVDGHLLMAYPLGTESLADRMRRRIGMPLALSYGQQMLDGLAHAHAKRIAHCDVKPDNIILFGRERIRLTDFGLARVARHTRVASGSGTLGYMAPEQAMGRASVRSDVFAAGLILYRMFAGTLPSWPFDWPLPGHPRLIERVTPGMANLLRRSLHVDQRRRFRDAQAMAQSYRRLLPAARRKAGVRPRPRAASQRSTRSRRRT